MAKKSTNIRLTSEKAGTSPTGRIIARVSASPLAFWMAMIIAVAAVVIYYPNHFGDYDIWWHLKYGEHFVTNATWSIDHTQFSWTETDASWKYVTWIGSSLLYLIHRFSGYAGLQVLQFFVLASIGMLLLLYMRKNGGKFGITHIAALLLCCIALNPTAIFIKPEQFTIILFTLAVFIYFSARKGPARLFYFYPPLFLVWVNTHGAFIIGLFFISAAFAFETADFLLLKTHPLNAKQWRAFLIAVCASYLATCINPYGPSYVIETLARMAGGGGSIGSLTAYINRWQFLFPDIYIFRRTNTSWAIVLMGVIQLYAIIRAYLRKHYIDLPLIALNVIFFVFAMNMARAILYFPAVWLFSLQDIQSGSGAGKASANADTAGLILIVAAAAVVSYNMTFQNIFTSWFGSMEQEFTPVKTVAMIRENKLPGPIFNDYLIGGYLIYSLYPDYKVFIDPRHRPFESTGVWSDFVSLRQRPTLETLNEIAGKYPFRTAIVHHLNYSDVTMLFLRSQDWTLIGLDTVSALFVHRSVLPEIDRLAIEKSISSENFREIANPGILTSLFQVYLYYSRDDAEKIMAIYEKNVGNRYPGKESTLTKMRMALGQQSQ